jgi:hypothetical protein
MKLHLGKNLDLPLDVASQAIAIFGIRGGGKSNTAGVIVEELLEAGRQVCVIDPTDAHWGYRSMADGKQAGYPVFVFGGEHADLALNEGDGKTIAEFIVDERVPIVLSIRHLRKAAQRRFVTDLATELYHLKGKPQNRTPLTVVIDEAPLFVPQRVMGEMTHVVGAIEDLVARGRNAGFGVVLVSQRPATLNADVRSLCDTIITHRVTSPLDRAALKKWIEENASINEQDTMLASLAKLTAGEAWIWAPALDMFERVKVRMRRTFDSSAAPMGGKRITPPKKLAEIDIESLKGKLAAAVEERKANDPKLLKQQIAALEKQLKGKTPAAAVPASREAIDQAVSRARVQWQRATVRERDQVNRYFKDAHQRIIAAQEVIRDALANTKVVPDEEPATPTITHKSHAPKAMEQKRTIVKPALQTRTNAAAAGDTAELGKADRAILKAFYWLKDQVATPSLVSFYSGYASTSSTWDRALGVLRRAHVSGWRITDVGIATVESWGVEPKPTGPQLRDWLRPRLDKASNAMLDALMQVYPRRLSNAELSEACGYATTSSTWDRAIGRLRATEAAEGYERDGGIKASDAFFEG